MTKKALKALKKSIEHWRGLATGKSSAGEGIGSNYCALCKLFIDNWGCAGCPVAERTGKSICRGTPYGEADRAFHGHGVGSEKFRLAAKKELEFLESLLP